MKNTRLGALAAALSVSALLLSACGSDNNTAATTTTSSTQPATTSAQVSTPEPASSSADSSAPSSASGGSSAPSAGSGQPSTGAGPTFEGAGVTCATGELRSSGSTAQGKAIGKWITDYNAKCGAKVGDYGGGGSGKGVTDFIAKQTDFGGSDSALKDDQFTKAKDRCAGSDAIDLPMVTGPIAIAFNVKGVDKLVLTPKVLVGIFGGQIAVWNDPQIAALNPGVTLPASPITTVHRAEESGTTDNFTKYLTAAGGWTFEGGKAWTAPGGQAEQGNDGVGKAVAATDGAIGYVEWGFAKDNNLHMAAIDNGSGPVELTAESAGKAVAAAQVVGTGKDLSLKLDYATKQAGAYPIILVTYEIVCSAGNGDKAEILKSFLGYAATDGQASLVGVGAAPLPAAVQTKVVEAVKALS